MDTLIAVLRRQAAKIFQPSLIVFSDLLPFLRTDRYPAFVRSGQALGSLRGAETARRAMRVWSKNTHNVYYGKYETQISVRSKKRHAIA